MLDSEWNMSMLGNPSMCAGASQARLEGWISYLHLLGSTGREVMAREIMKQRRELFLVLGCVDVLGARISLVQVSLTISEPTSLAANFSSSLIAY